MTVAALVILLIGFGAFLYGYYQLYKIERDEARNMVEWQQRQAKYRQGLPDKSPKHPVPVIPKHRSKK